ncbi:MAG: hypothetical protein U0941_16060 [Planctomycetaceae bacterium]
MRRRTKGVLAMVEPDEVLQVLKQRLAETGVSQTSFSDKCGLERHLLRKVLLGERDINAIEARNYAKIVRGLQRVLGTRLSASDQTVELNEEYPINVSDFDIVGPELWSMTSWISWTRCSHSYWMSDAMRLWFLADGFKRRGHPDEWTQKYITQTARIRRYDRELLTSDRRRFTNTVVMQDEVFRQAAVIHPEWLNETADELDQCRQTRIHVCDPANWAAVSRAVCDATNWWGYCTVDVFDEYIAILSPACGGPSFAVRDRKRVCAIRAAIEKGQSLARSYRDTPDQLRAITRDCEAISGKAAMKSKSFATGFVIGVEHNASRASECGSAAASQTAPCDLT